MNPPAITFEILEQVPVALFFDDVKGMIFFHLPDNRITGIGPGANVGDIGFHTQPFRLCDVRSGHENQ